MKDDYIKTNITLRKVDSETKNLIKRNFKFGLYSDENCKNLIKDISTAELLGKADMYDGISEEAYKLVTEILLYVYNLEKEGNSE